MRDPYRARKLYEWLNAACRANDLDAVKHICQIADPKWYGGECMSVAADEGNIEIVRYLLTLMPKAYGRRSAFIKACRRGHADIVRLLFVDVPDADIRISTYEAERNGNKTIFNLISEMLT